MIKIQSIPNVKDNIVITTLLLFFKFYINVGFKFKIQIWLDLNWGFIIEPYPKMLGITPGSRVPCSLEVKHPVTYCVYCLSNPDKCEFLTGKYNLF